MNKNPIITFAAVALMGFVGCSSDGSGKSNSDNNTALDMGGMTSGSNSGTNGSTNGTANGTPNVATNNNAMTSDMGMTTAVDMYVAPDLGPPNPLTDWCTGQGDDFSFFVTSMGALWVLSESDPADLSGGFGGDFGGIEGADEICQTIGEATGSTKTWRAFLSATEDGAGSPVHAIERVGAGPWTDANGRLVANDIAGLLADNRPDGDAQSTQDLPDECGVPLSALGDAHDVVTGSNEQGMLNDADPDTTCNDWTSSDGAVGSSPSGGRGKVMCGHSFPRANNSGLHWMSEHPVRGCGKGANLNNGPAEGTCIGCSGGYGALYCFAL